MNSPVDAGVAQADEGSSSSDREIFRDLGDYRLLARLGTGGMGQVYKAMHRRLERLVAIKMLPSYQTSDPSALARFDREIKAAGRVMHPNVVQAFDAQEIDGTRFLVMEYIDGVNLSLLVRMCGPLKIADACELICQAALGLQAAHERGLVHRDVKPSNLMLSRGGQLKLLDLGLARFRAEPVETGEMTEIGQTIGTAEYIAPEQVVDSHRVDIRADIYSLGCTMFRLLTGKPPFFGPKYPSAVEKMMAHLKEPPPSIRELRSDISAPLAEIIGRMLAKDPSERFAMPGDVAAALAPHAAGSDLRDLMRQIDAEYPFVTASRRRSGTSCSVKEVTVGSKAKSAKTGPAGSSSMAKASRAPAWGMTPARRLAISLAALGVLLLILLAGFSRPGILPADVKKASAAAANSPLPPEEDLHGKLLSQNQWTNLLPYVDLERDRVSNRWDRRKEGIGCRGENGYPRIAMPVTLHGDYDLEVEFVRNSGDGLIRIMFPVGDRNMPQLLFAAGDGTLAGFNEYEGHGLADPRNPTARETETLVNGRRYKAAISVRLHGDQAAIDVHFDGKPLLQCTAPPAVFPAYQFADPAELVRPVVGVAAGSDATFSSVRVRVVNGAGAIKARRITQTCPHGEWVDLFDRIDVKRDRLSGNVKRDGHEIRLSESKTQAALVLPAALGGSYKLRMEFSHDPASGMISFMVPVGLRRVRVNINIPGELHPEPATINRPEARLAEGEGSTPMRELEAGVRHVLVLTVHADAGAAAIDVKIDGNPWLSWAGPEASLHDGPIIMTEPDRIALVIGGTIRLSSVTLRALYGRAALIAENGSSTEK